MRLCALALGGAALGVLPAVLLQPCGDWHAAACPAVLDLTLCGLYPALSRQFCGASCGWCYADGSFRPRVPVQAPKWHQIERVPANMTMADFERRYKSKHIPVIFENWVQEAAPTLAQWNLDELSRVCGDTRVGVAERRAAFLGSMDAQLRGGIARHAVDAYTRWKFNTTIADALGLAVTEHRLKDFIAMLRATPAQPPAMDFGTILHYMALPLSVNDFSADRLCHGLWQDSVLPVWATVGNLRHPKESRCLDDRRLKPSVFIEGSGSRAYPAHQHGNDFSHGFQVMLEGAKRVVHWPYSERHKLYPVLRDMTTEFHEEVFMAEGVHRRFDLFPSMADAEAWEGTVQEGELLFVPGLGVHVFESVGVSFGLRFMHQDKAAARMGRHLVDEGAPVDEGMVEELESLRPYPPEMEESSLPALAQRLGCYA